MSASSSIPPASKIVPDGSEAAIPELKDMLAEPMTSPEKDTLAHEVTVEDFLRWSVAAPRSSGRIRKMPHIKLGIASDGAESDNEADFNSMSAPIRKRRRGLRRLPASDEEYQPSDQERSYTPSPKSSKKTANKRKATSRLLYAAVMSHVDINPKDLPTRAGERRPLKFATKSNVTPPPCVLNPDKLRVVDPRRITFHSSVFEKTNHGEDQTRSRTVTSFAPALLNNVVSSPSKASTSKSAQKFVATQQGKPISFVQVRRINSDRSK